MLSLAFLKKEKKMVKFKFVLICVNSCIYGISFEGRYQSTRNKIAVGGTVDHELMAEAKIFSPSGEGSNPVPATPVWDPFFQSDNVPTPQCLLRIKRDIKTLYDDPPPNIFVVADEKDFTIIHALITGTFDTPYEGGFFYFFLKCPSNYPMRPPWVKFMTTAGGTVRMNPNLYKNGKVCLSILGTWPGPGWSPANTLASCLMSIQSLLGEKPYHNEPGYDQERIYGDSQRYNDVIQHETLRVAVCGMIDNDFGINIPESLVQVMEKTFLEFYDIYESIARRNLHLNNKNMVDPFGEKRGKYQYETILKRLIECKKKILLKLKSKVEIVDEESPSSSSSSSSSSDMDDSPSETEAQKFVANASPKKTVQKQNNA